MATAAQKYEVRDYIAISLKELGYLKDEMVSGFSIYITEHQLEIKYLDSYECYCLCLPFYSGYDDPVAIGAINCINHIKNYYYYPMLNPPL